MKQILHILCLLLGAFASIAGAVETPLPLYQFSKIAPEGSIWMGATLFDPSGSTQAAEYEFLQDSISGGGSIMALWDPVYVYAEGDILNKNDFFGDSRLALGELVTMRWITRRLYHNLNNIELRDYDLTNVMSGIDIQDSKESYGLRSDINQLAVRLQPIAFPFYLYVDGFRIDRKGQKQFRFLGGSGFFNDLQRTSTHRSIDETAREIKAGFNAHLGPIELDYAHSDLDYDPAGDKVLLYPFSFAGVRSAGVYEVGRTPKITGFSETIRMHSNYGGSIYAGTTLSYSKRKNEFSRVSIDYRIFQGEVLWMPFTKLRMVTKYRWQKADTSQPDQGNGRSSYDAETSRLQAALRYRLRPRTTFRAEFIHASLKRDSRYARDWRVAESKNQNTLTLGIDTRPHRTLQVKVQYAHQETDENTKSLALGIEPTRSNEGKLSVSWTPLMQLTAQLQLSATKEEKEKLQLLDEEGHPLNEMLNRDDLSQRLFFNIHWGINDRLWLTPSYVYLKHKIDQDLAYNAWPPTRPLIDRNVRSADKAHHYAINLNYKPSRTVNLEAMCAFTSSQGNVYTMQYDATNPISVVPFSNVDIEEWTFKSRLQVDLSKNVSVKCSYRYTHYDDNAPDNIEDGNFHMFETMIVRNW